MTKAKVDVPANALSNPKRKKVYIGRLVLPYAMVLPTVLLLAVFTFYPAIDMIINSFYDINVFKGNTFVGFDNYVRLFNHPDFWPAVRNTLIYTLGSVFFLIVLGLIFALWLQRSTFINGIVQRFMFLPHICALLSVAMIFQWLMDDEGLFNFVLSWFNLPGLKWFNSSDTAMISIMIVSIWKGIGYYALILLSAVKSIPTELLEAADLDDSGKLRTFFKISLPMLSPQIFFLLITITINSFKVFDSVRILTNGLCDTNVLVFLIYTLNKTSGQAGVAAAAGTVLLIILMIFTVIYFRVLGKRVHYQ
ncbi:MAG: sugar ABC transporter permease [Ruminococcaceae bacterium]|nr:sugar ABC transporter permease [Oscillospiraceae bacterium]